MARQGGDRSLLQQAAGPPVAAGAAATLASAAAAAASAGVVGAAGDSSTSGRGSGGGSRRGSNSISSGRSSPPGRKAAYRPVAAATTPPPPPSSSSGNISNSLCEAEEGVCGGRALLGFGGEGGGDSDRERLMRALSRALTGDLVSPCSKHIVLESRLQMHVLFSALSQFGCSSLLCCNVLPQQQQQQGAAAAGFPPAPSSSSSSSSSSSGSAPLQCCGGPGQSACCSSRGVWIYSEAKRRFLGRLDARHLVRFFLQWHRWLAATQQQQQQQQQEGQGQGESAAAARDASCSSSSSEAGGRDTPTRASTTEDARAAVNSSSSSSSNSGSNSGSSSSDSSSSDSSSDSSSSSSSSSKETPQPAAGTETAAPKNKEADATPPWALTLEAFRNMHGASVGEVQRVLPNCDAATALLQLLESKAPYLCVINDGRKAPLALLTAHGFLLHIVTEVRSSSSSSNSSGSNNLGTHDKVLTYCIDGSAAGFLTASEASGFSSVPLVDRNGVYVTCFALDHFLAVVLKRLHDGATLDLLAPVSEFLSQFQQLQWQHRMLCSAAAAAAATAASNEVLLLPSPGSSSGSSRRGAAAAAALGRLALAGTPQPVYRGTVESKEAASLTLQEAILKILFSDEQKIIWLGEE
ncbi:hypothetical protein Efla_004332 [Eimeria flavescens]